MHDGVLLKYLSYLLCIKPEDKGRTQMFNYGINNMFPHKLGAKFLNLFFLYLIPKLSLYGNLTQRSWYDQGWKRFGFKKGNDFSLSRAGTKKDTQAARACTGMITKYL